MPVTNFFPVISIQSRNESWRPCLVKRLRHIFSVALVMGMLLAAPAPSSAQQATAPRQLAELSQLAEDVYIYRSGGIFAMFIVTDEGVVASAHISQNRNLKAAQLYRAVIAAVTDKPVRYVVYDHDHADGIIGLSVFRDTAQYVSHRLAAPKIAARKDPLQPVPTLLVDKQHTIELGGKKIELHYIGRGHTDNMLVMHYPARRVLWVGDFVSVRSFGRPDPEDTYPDDYVRALRWMEDNLGASYDVLAPGHGNVLGAPADVRQGREYWESLIAAIRAARTRNLADNSPEMIEAVRAALAPRFGAWNGFAAGVAQNIQAVIRSWAEGR